MYFQILLELIKDAKVTRKSNFFTRRKRVNLQQREIQEKQEHISYVNEIFVRLKMASKKVSR